MSSNCIVELTLSIPRKVKSIRDNVERNVSLGTIEFVGFVDVRHGHIIHHIRTKCFNFVTNTTDKLAGMQPNDDVTLYEFARSYFGIDAVWYYHIKDKNLLVKCSLIASQLWELLLSLYSEDKLPTVIQFAVKCEPCVR